MASTRNRSGREDPPDDDDDLDERIATAVNAAVGDHIKRKLPRMLTEALDKPLGELRTLIEQRAAAPAEGDDPDDEQPDDPPAQRRSGKGRQQQQRQQEQPAQPAGRRRDDPELTRIRKELDTLKTERQTEREQARNRDRDAQLRDHLTKLGVEPNRLRGAIAVLRESTKWDEKNGTWAYVAKREGFDEELDLDAGATEWAGTDEGKAYLAPPQRTGASAGQGAGPQIRQPVRSGGSGARPGAGRATGATSPTGQQQQRGQAKQDAVTNLAGAVDALLGGAVQIG